MGEMNTALFVFVGTSAIVQCYLDDLILFAGDEKFLDNLCPKLGQYFRVKDLGKPRGFLRLNLKCNDNDSVSFSLEHLKNILLQDTVIAQSK